MPVLNRAAEMQEEVAGWRRHLHEHPELLYDVYETAAFVADKLKAFGCDLVETGIGRTGVVGIIKGRHGDGPVVGLRADMDALPIFETSGKPWASKVLGKAHSCGHDGHTAMLLGAARHLAETRNFRGSVAVIFQPAEEGGGGALAMVEDGFLDKFRIGQVYGMHNAPGLALGQFAIRKGSVMAAADTFEIAVTGRGSHAAQPHLAIDPIVTASHIVVALQSIVSRETDPLKSLVVTVASIHGGDANNVIPDTVRMTGTVRTLLPETRDFAEGRVREVAGATAQAHGAVVDIAYMRGYPVTFNHDTETEFAAGVAGKIVGDNFVDTTMPPHMGAEDFSYMLERRPGAFIFIGNGDTASLHNPAYDFNDGALPYGISYWVALAETSLAA